MGILVDFFGGVLVLVLDVIILVMWGMFMNKNEEKLEKNSSVNGIQEDVKKRKS